jgi:hypothetical protein
LGRTLRYLGIAILAVTAWLLMADAVGWIPAGSGDAWISRGVWAGGGCILVGILFGMMSPVGRELRRGHCVRCGVSIERGQTYCADHLQATVNEYRDQTREGVLGKTGRR